MLRCSLRSLGLFALGMLLLASAAVSAEEKSVRQLIDAEVQAAWQKHNLTPTPKADDAAFLRRIYLDILGTIPTYDEARQFLADTDPQKRQQLIDKLLDDPRHAQHQADVWDLVLFGRHPPGGDALRKRDEFKKWLADKFIKNEPYDRWVRELLLAEQEGTELYYVQFRNQPEEATVAVSKTFLGTQLQCARCHDHPFDVWTQKDFYGMTGFFVRLVVFDAGGQVQMGKRRFMIGEKSTGEVLFTGAVKDQKPGQKGEPVKAKFLGGEVVEDPALPKDFKEPDLKTVKTLPRPVFSRKEKLADWVTRADNAYFARAVANRLWAQFMGRGLAHPIDDFSDKNKPSMPALLQAMSEGLKAQQFDLKWLIREIVNSQAYQRAATGAATDALPPWYERARVRPLSAEEMMAALRVATGFDKDAKMPGASSEYFLRYFGEPTNGRGDFQGSLTEHLFLNNSSEIRQMIQRKKDNLADQLLLAKEPWQERIDRLFLSVLTRLPKDRERERFVAFLSDAAAKPDARLEEAIWVLLNCAEFRFNH